MYHTFKGFPQSQNKKKMRTTESDALSSITFVNHQFSGTIACQRYFFINVWRKKVFDIHFTEFGTVMTTVLPVLFKYCYKYCYSDSRKLWAVMKGGGLALYNLIQPTISFEMPVPSQGHYGFHSFPVVDWFCLFIYLWVLTFPL